MAGRAVRAGMAGVAVLAACSDGDVESDRVFVLTAVNGLMPALVANSQNPTWPFVVVVADTLTLRPDGTYVESTITTLANESGQEGTLFRGVVEGTYQRTSPERVTFSAEVSVGYSLANGNSGSLPGEGLVLDQRSDADRITDGPDVVEFREIEPD
jgi:hypothetical protein